MLSFIEIKQNNVEERGEIPILNWWLALLLFAIFFFFVFFFFHSFLPRLLPPPHFLSSAEFPLSLLSPAVVVMPTSQETVLSWIPSGRADQLMSGVIQACAQIGLLYVRSFPPFFAVSSRSPHTSQPNTN